MLSNKTMSEVDLRALNEIPITEHNTIDLVSTILISGTLVPRHSGRVII